LQAQRPAWLSDHFRHASTLGIVIRRLLVDVRCGLLFLEGRYRGLETV